MAASRAPRLRELDLSSNYITLVPAAAADGRGFELLEWLNLADNYIAHEEDVVQLFRLPRLQQTLLYGNPLIAASRTEAMAALNERESAGVLVNLVTDNPAGPRATRPVRYGNFRVTRVVDPPLPTGAQWREAGNKLLFEGSDSEGDGPEARARALRWGALGDQVARAGCRSCFHSSRRARAWRSSRRAAAAT